MKPAKLFLSAFVLALASQSVVAEETLGEKAEAKAEHATNQAKKKARETKKEARDAAGKGSLKEDVKGELKNAGDYIEEQGNNVKRKAN